MHSDINTEPLLRQKTTQQTETTTYIQNNLILQQNDVQETSSLYDILLNNFNLKKKPSIATPETDEIGEEVIKVDRMSIPDAL